MNLKTVIALAIAAAFSAPLAAQTSPSADKTTGGSNAADRPANTAQPAPVPAPKPETGAAATGATAAGGFAALDKNNDGYLSREEVRDASWSNRFSELDKDNDGRLSRSEFEAMQAGTGASGAVTSPSTTGGMGGSVGPAGTQSGSSTSGIGDKPGQKQ